MKMCAKKYEIKGGLDGISCFSVALLKATMVRMMTTKKKKKKGSEDQDQKW